MPKLYTIGYEGKNIGDFVEELVENRVETLVDVRELPLSRKKGFSKTALRNAVESKGIEYVHTREVGTPKPIRKELYETWNYDKFFKDYGEHLNGCNSGLSEVVDLSYSGNACLMCYEADASKCHRSYLANKVSEIGGNGLRVKNL